MTDPLQPPQPQPLQPRHQPQRASARSIAALSLAGVGLVACSRPPIPDTLTATSSTSDPSKAVTPSRPPAAEASLAVRQQVADLQQRIDSLAAAIAEFWKAHGRDDEYGGFYATLDAQGQPSTPAQKSLSQQARHLWSMSSWYERRESTPEVKALADDLYDFLIRHFHDPETDDFFHKVSAAGEVVDTTKQLHAQAFAIVGLSRYSIAFQHPESAQYALRCFEAIDARGHDPEFGGYDQTEDPEPLPANAQKATRTHLHLMAALMELDAATGEPGVRQRLRELVDVLVHRVIGEQGYAHKEFSRDWTPIGPPRVSYGHDLETFWLLDRAAKALHHDADGAVASAALRVGRNAALSGFDAARGGYYAEAIPGGTPTEAEKRWWVQAEALPALFRLFERTADSKYLEHLEATLTFIERQLVTPLGEWVWGVTPDGALSPHGANLSDEEKASYHTVRATMNTGDWMRAWLRQNPSTGG